MWRGTRLYASWVLLAMTACDSGDGDVDPITPAPSASAIERYCVTETACLAELDDGVFARGLASCIEGLERAGASTAPAAPWLAARLDCFRAAGTDCAAVEACTGVVRSTMVCEERIESCQGSVRVICELGGATLRGEDCAAKAQLCIADTAGVTRCTDGSCDESTPDLRCDGSDVVRCSSAGWESRQRCPRDAPCGPYEDELGEMSVRCGGDTVCRAACEGDDLVSCYDGTFDDVRVRVDCASLGQRCVASSDGFPECETMEPDEECAEDPSGLCASGIVELCVFGRRRRVDCRALGWDGCTAGPNGPVCIRSGG